MNPSLVPLLALATLMAATGAHAQATFYGDDTYGGPSLTANLRVPNFQRYGFNNQASSVVVAAERWEVCDDVQYGGRCVVLRPGRYPSLAAMGLNNRVSSARLIGRDVRIADHRYAPLPGMPPASVVFFDREGFDGRSFTTTQPVANLRRGLNARVASAIVTGWGWEVCEDNRYRGRCVVLRPGRYQSLAAMGMDDRIASVRRVDRAQDRDDARNERNERPYGAERPAYDGRRRDGERLYEAPVTSSRAVLATPGQRCWVERERVPTAIGGANIPGAIAGALIGGILGHQVGDGSGQDIATVGGVVAGAALGSQVGRAGASSTQDVQRCENIPGGAQAAWWDVSYSFRGRDHRVQMTSPPGRTVIVNSEGEPRERD